MVYTSWSSQATSPSYFEVEQRVEMWLAHIKQLKETLTRVLGLWQLGDSMNAGVYSRDRWLGMSSNSPGNLEYAGCSVVAVLLAL